MKTRLFIILTALLMLAGIGANAQTKYYWYAGEGPIMSSTVPGSDSNWHLIEGTPNCIETGDLARDVKINWVLAIPVSTGLTRISNGEDVTDAYDVSTVTTADGVEYKVFTQIEPSKRTSIYFVDGKTKYYLYFGTTLPTADNIASIANITEDVPEYAIFEDGHRWSLRNETNESADAYICIPSVYNVIWKDENGEAIDLIDVSTFTSGSIDYKVQKLKSQLGAGEKKYIYAYNSNAGDYYIYIGLNCPTADTDPESDLAINKQPLIEGCEAAGWRNIGMSITQYNAGNPAFNGGSNTVILDKDFNDVVCYVAIPVRMGIFDGLGNTGGWITDQPIITIKGHQYIVYKSTVEGEFAQLIYRTGLTYYTVTYMVDGEVWEIYKWLVEGAQVPVEPEPKKDGYTFSGWSTIPTTMPAENVTVTGTFSLITDEDEITIKEIGKTTYCSKYDLDFTNVAGIKAYTATGYDDNDKTIWLTRVMKVPAGTGLLVKGDEGTYKVPHANVRAYYTNMLVGNLGETISIGETDGDKTNYYLKDGTFKSVNGNANIGKNKAYLQLPTNIFAGTRSIGISYDDEDGTTGIREAKQSREDGAYYTLQGQRVVNPGKGLYIKNGKKVVIK